MSNQRKQPEIKLYNGFGSPTRAIIMGHLLKSSKHLERRRVSTNIFRNAWEMIKRYQVEPWRGQELTITMMEQQHTVTTDRSGYFELVVPAKDAKEPVIVQLNRDPAIRAEGTIRIFNPSEILISDIDDTIVISHSTSLFKKLYTLLSRNHQRRKPFRGVQDFYRELYHLENEQVFIYVSSSEWNLYDFIDDFCRFHGLPHGYYLLQDLKSGLLDLFRSGGGSHQHKRDKIEFILGMFETAQVTLIGDSGQKDSRIYEQIAKTYTGRMNKIWIRALNHKKHAKLEKIKSKLFDIGVSMEIFS